MGNSNVIKVLVVEDSIVFREMIVEGLKKDSKIEVIGAAGDPFVARDMIVEDPPDVITLDIELPKMDGITFLKKLMPQYPLPAVVVSGHYESIMDALGAGAIDFVKKPTANTAEGLENFLQEMIVKIKIASVANVKAFKSVHAFGGQISRNRNQMVIAIGASTGGTEAIFEIISKLPCSMPGIVIAQHMPEGFTKMYADRLNGASQLEVKEAQDGDAVLPGRVLLAPGGLHMKLVRNDGRYAVKCYTGEKINGHRPSVDVLFHSVAKEAGDKAIGVILTGMGYDGVKGLLQMREAGAMTIGQDEATSIVYGMPKAAYDVGAVKEQLPIREIAQRIYAFADLSNIKG